MQDVNVLSFRMIDPKKAGEAWTIYYAHHVPQVVEIRIDGKRLMDMVDEIERPYRINSGSLRPGYGHITPIDLWVGITLGTETIRKHRYAMKDAIVFWCGSCHEESCDSFHLTISEDDEYVYWKDFRRRSVEPDPKYESLSFRFDRKQYVEEIDRLRQLCRARNRAF